MVTPTICTNCRSSSLRTLTSYRPTELSFDDCPDFFVWVLACSSCGQLSRFIPTEFMPMIRENSVEPNFSNLPALPRGRE